MKWVALHRSDSLHLHHCNNLNSSTAWYLMRDKSRGKPLSLVEITQEPIKGKLKKKKKVSLYQKKNNSGKQKNYCDQNMPFCLLCRNAKSNNYRFKTSVFLSTLWNEYFTIQHNPLLPSTSSLPLLFPGNCTLTTLSMACALGHVSDSSTTKLTA